MPVVESSKEILAAYHPVHPLDKQLSFRPDGGTETGDEDDEDLIIHEKLPFPPSHPLSQPLLPIARTGPHSIHKRFSRSHIRTFLWFIASFSLFLCLSFWVGRPSALRSTLLLDRLRFSEIMARKFNPASSSINWLTEAGDGVYSQVDHQGIKLVDLPKDTTHILLPPDVLKDSNGTPIPPDSFSVSSDLRFILLATDTFKQWRYSTMSNFQIFDTHTHSLIPLRPEAVPSLPTIALAKWSPTGHYIAYVHLNDIYVVSSPDQAHSALRLTNTGTSTVFNGICDWVYEEEVFSQSSAMWWSPDSKKLVWLTFDESAVHNYDITVYNPTRVAGQVSPYRQSRVMKYPKPGFKNPVVTIKMLDVDQLSRVAAQVRIEDHIYELRLDPAFPDDDRIVMEVAWVSNHELIVRETNRNARQEKTGYFNFEDQATNAGPAPLKHGKTIMDLDFLQIDGGWAEPGQFIRPINPTLDPKYDTLARGHLDVRIDPSGYRHLAYFSPSDSNQPVFLSSGQWEVDGPILGVDLDRRLVYFTGAKPSIDRHLFSIRLPSGAELTQLKQLQPRTQTSPSDQSAIRRWSEIVNLKQLTTPPATPEGWESATYSAHFSHLAGYYLLVYHGPGLPSQRIVRVVDQDGNEPTREVVKVLEDNSTLNQTLSNYELPRWHYGTVKNSEGQDMNVEEIRPLNMDLSGKVKYPVLFKVYGGPNSQTVNSRFGIDWSHYLASELNYLVVLLDGRGTGFRGRQFRVGVRDNLGYLEAVDVSTAAKHYAGLKYVDPSRIGIWGWSYGGYLTCKVAESYSSIFSMALAVAPVIDWRYYDSVYTERYMSTLDQNSRGYEQSAVHNVDGFKNLSFSLAHGTADDNVHFLNSVELLDRFTAEHVKGFQFRLFVDSDHTISNRGAYEELFEWMEDFLRRIWGNGIEPKPQPPTTSPSSSTSSLGSRNGRKRPVGAAAAE